jgi:protoporphyrinogen oxidase
MSASISMCALTILGGGPAGLAVALYAHRAGLRFALYEKAAQLGGLCRTLRHGDHLYDCGAHRFHDRDADITADVRAFLGDELITVDSPSKIYDRRRFIDFPPTPLNVLFSGLGPVEAFRIAADFIRSRSRGRELVSFEDFAISQFGETLARRILLNYSEKLWGLPASELSPDVATRRLSGMSLASLFLELFLPRRKTAHIDGAFLYPKHGYGKIVEALEAAVPADSLCREHELASIRCERGRIVEIEFTGRGTAEIFGRVVSTLPLTMLVRLLGSAASDEARAAAKELRFRQIRIFFLRLRQPSVSSNASIYLPDPRFVISRLYEPRNRSALMAPVGETSLVVEVPCFEGDATFTLETNQLARRVIGELAEVGLINPARVIEWRHHLLANAYPVYSLGYAGRVETIRNALGAIENLDLLGRGGTFFYSHLHDQMRFAKDYIGGLRAP